jgi:dATP pyrophosphohydrolase
MNIISEMIELHVFHSGKIGLEFLLLKRSDKDIYHGLWQMISGHIVENETAVAAALRELKEETNLVPLHLWIAPNVNSFYSADKDCISVIPVFAAQVKENAKVIISDEHTEYIWVNAAKVKNLLAWEGQRKSVELIEEYFMNQMNFLKFIEVNLSSLS